MTRKFVTCLNSILLQNNPQNIYTRKELVMTEKKISNFHTSFYIPKIQKLVFHIPHVQILGTNHCDKSCWTAFKLRESFQDALCCRDYAERLVASFPHQIQSEYYGGNISVSIEVIALEHFSELFKTGINASTKSCPRHAVFHTFSVRWYQTRFCHYYCTQKAFDCTAKIKKYWGHH